MNKIKLVITHPSQLSERWVNYYYLDDLCKDFDLEFWDCSAIAYPSFTVASPLLRNYLRIIKSLEQFERELKKLPQDTVLITEVHHNAKTFPFHKIQGRYFSIIAHLGFYGNDIRSIWPQEADKNGSMIQKLKSVLYQSKTIKHIVKWLFHKNDADYYENMMRGKSSERYRQVEEFSCIKSSKYRINHPDFETYLSIRDRERFIKDKYVVFIDDYYPYHPEAYIDSKQSMLEQIAADYYRSMNKYFWQVEKQLNCKVVIAAHPYANYKEKNPFEGREVYYGKTALLIKDCEAVCLHCSNAFSYVALFDKPVMFIVNNAMNSSNDASATYVYGEKFHQPVLNSDTDETYIFHKIENDLRLKYIYDYLGDMSIQQSNKDLFVKYLTEFHDTYLLKR